MLILFGRMGNNELFLASYKAKRLKAERFTFIQKPPMEFQTIFIEKTNKKVPNP